MISPKNVYNEAKKRENENLRFRSFLKNHADEEELDRHFWNSTRSCSQGTTAVSAATAAVLSAMP